MPNRRKRPIVLFVAALVVAAAIGAGFVGSIRHPTPNAEGGAIVAASPAPTTSATASPTTTPGRLRLASFNIHSGKGTDKRRDLTRTAGLLEGFDLICLNEVRGGGPGWHDQAQQLGAILRMQPLFAPTERRWGSESFGNAVLTHRGIERWQRIRLPSSPGQGYRNVLRLIVPFGSEKLHVLMTHVGRDEDNAPQMRAVAKMLLDAPAPAVLLGDMNTTPDDPVVRNLIEQHGVREPVGERTGNNQRFDLILLRGVDWTDAGVVANDASDHPMVWVELQARESS